MAGIHGGPDGAYSIALSGGYEDDIDMGECFTYTGQGEHCYLNPSLLCKPCRSDFLGNLPRGISVLASLKKIRIVL